MPSFVFCPQCAHQNESSDFPCANCGKTLPQRRHSGALQQNFVPVNREIQSPHFKTEDAGKKIPAGICGILLGPLGIHKFILGYPVEGIIMLVGSIAGSFFCLGIPPIVFTIIGLIEGIIYLSKSDHDFFTTYIAKKKGWF